MKYLGLDVGTKRTGAAFADTKDDILFSLSTIEHTSEEDLLHHVLRIVEDRAIDEIVLGNPLLLSGEEGSQAAFVQSVLNKFLEAGMQCSLLDERYTTPKNAKFDRNAASACQILQVKLSKK